MTKRKDTKLTFCPNRPRKESRMTKWKDTKLTMVTGIFALLALAAPSLAVELCSIQVAQINHACSTQSLLQAHLPCGVTKRNSSECYRIHTNEFGCTFALGDWEDADFIAVWWPTKPGSPKPVPSRAECQAAEQSVQLCREEPADPGCPDNPVSEEEGCQLFCEPLVPDGDGSRFWEGDSEFWSKGGWDEGCRAFALMREGWRADPWQPAEGFFTVGRAFPAEALGWESEDGPYTADRALADGYLGRTVLGGVGSTPLWGAGDGLIERDWRRLVRRAGVCVNEPGALLASPFWPNDRGIRRFPALVECGGAAQKGLTLWANAAGWDEETWAASGAAIEDVVPRLQKLDGFELVCVTVERAQERRRQRASASETSLPSSP